MVSNEIMSHQKHDAGVIMEARSGASDLLKRIYDAPDIAELAVNPLLLTMIANVHRFHTSLPGRRVELYAEMCDVFLGKSELARGLSIELTPAQKQSVLQPLAYAMMKRKTREIPVKEALKIIAEPLSLLTLSMHGSVFLEMIRDRSSILLERENGVYAFAHKTYQEFLTAEHIRQEQLQAELIQFIDNDWWHETIRLYCARADATLIIAACLAKDPPPIPQLVLAIECMEEGLKIDPDMREKLQQVIDADIESEDPQRRTIAAEAQLALRLRRLTRQNDDTYIDQKPITYAEFQLFINQEPLFIPDHWEDGNFSLGTGKEPAVGMTGEAALVFCEWLTARQPENDWYYRLPQPDELSQSALCWTRENKQIALAKPQSTQLPLWEWLLSSDGELTDKIKQEVVIVDFYSGTLASASARARARASARALDRANARALDHARGLARALDRTSDLNSALAHALNRDRDRFSVITLTLTRALVIALTSARDLASALTLTRDLPSASDLARALDCDLTSARDLARALDRASDLNNYISRDLARVEISPLMEFYLQVALLIHGYIRLIIFLTASTRPAVRVAEFKLTQALNDELRKYVLEAVKEHYQKQPQQLLDNTKWEKWKARLDTLLQDYATLAMVERRRTGEWQAFETIRIVKARRPQTDTKK